jgi:TRAP-type C4-dicarboxylate transport system substrate-binding protein
MPIKRTICFIAVFCIPSFEIVRAEILLKVADRYPARHYISEAGAKVWMEKVTAATNGEVRFQYFPSEQLGKTKDMMALTLSGVTDIGEIATGYVSEKLPLSSLVELPESFTTSCQGSLAAYELSQPGGVLFEKEYGPQGLRVLIALTPSPYQIFARPKLQVLSDLKGLKLRSAGGGMDVLLRQLDAVPIKVSPAETYQALSRGTIDAAVMPTASIPAYDLASFTKNSLMGTNFGSTLLIYTISERKWRQLPTTVQEAMTKAGEETTRSLCARSEQEDRSALDKLKAVGMTVNTISGTDEARLRELAAPISREWATSMDAAGKDGTAALQAFGDAIIKYALKP